MKKLANAALATATNEFFREASLMMSIAPHPNLIKLYGMCQEPSNFSLIMEFLAGGSLDSLIQDHFESGKWPLPEPLLWRIAHGMAAGMASLSSQNIIHRDLAARNVLLDTNLDPRIADFGFSRVVDADEGQGKTNSTVGPIRWMAPESIRDRGYSEKSDVWAYGMTMIELTSGYEPFHGEDILSVATKVRDEAATPKIPVDCPSFLRTIIEQCWAADPINRPSFNEIMALLEPHRPVGYVPMTAADLRPEPREGSHKNAGNYDETALRENRTNKTNKSKSKSKEPDWN